MADNVDVKLGGKSQEEVALVLMGHVLTAEGKGEAYGVFQGATKQDILSTYRECLKVVRNPFLNE